MHPDLYAGQAQLVQLMGSWGSLQHGEASLTPFSNPPLWVVETCTVVGGIQTEVAESCQ